MSLLLLKDQLVLPLDKVHDLGIILDSRLNMEVHVANVVCCSFYHLWQLRCIRRSLTTNARQTLTTVFVTNWVHYGNAVLYSTSAVVIRHLQMVLMPPLISLLVLVNMSTSYWFFVKSFLDASATDDTVQNCYTDFLTASEAPSLSTSVAMPAQSLTIQAVLVSAQPSAAICSFHKVEQLGS